MSVQKKGLGRGLSSLILNIDEDSVINAARENIIELDISKVKPNKDQPRKNFPEDSLRELAESISKYGLIQPILVKKQEDDYQIIAGERRWRASKMAKLEKIPAIIKEYSAQEILAVSLIENIQRENLNPIEEANCYNLFIKDFNLGQDEIAEKIGISKRTITNSLRLLNLDSRVQDLIIENKITNGHAMALVRISDKDTQFRIAERIINENLTVKKVELLVKEIILSPSQEKKEIIKKEMNTIYQGFAKKLEKLLGTKVQIINSRKNKRIEIEYHSEEDLNRLLGLVKVIE